MQYLQPNPASRMISDPSIRSLYLQPMFDGTPLSNATGFVVDSAIGRLLITNRHVVTGRHQSTDQPMSSHGGVPNQLAISHHEKNQLGKTFITTESLLNADGSPRWIEHPRLGRAVDFVALPIAEPQNADLFLYKLDQTPNEGMLVPASRVSVVGFPFGLRAGEAFAIWATGFVASEPDVDMEGLPYFLIDCRTRPGQSGSAVIAQFEAGEMIPTRNGPIVMPKPLVQLLGIYSGRVNENSDLGMVWKISALRELVAAISHSAWQNPIVSTTFKFT